MENYEDVLAPCIYHCWWPGSNDPLYLHNTAPVHARITNFYSINVAPTVVVDGVAEPVPYPYPYAQLAAYVENRAAVPSPIIIDCSGGIVGGNPSGVCDVDIDVTVETPQIATDYRLFVALVEDSIYLPSPNGETDHHYTFRWFNNNGSSPGEPIDLTSAGTQHFDYTFTFHPDVYQADQMSVTAWVQRANREVVQGGRGVLEATYFVMTHYAGPTAKIGGASEVVVFDGEVENFGNNDDTYDVTVTGVPAGWSYSYTTSAGTFSGPSTLPLTAATTSPLTLELDSQGASGPAEVTITFQSQGAAANVASLTYQKMNSLQVLLVDDDDGEAREAYIEPALAAAGVSWGTWNRTLGELSADDLSTAASSVFWACGASTSTLTEADRTALAGYMDTGNAVFLSGCDVAYDLNDPGSPNYSPAASQWFEDYLHTEYTDNFSFSLTADGTPGDPIGDGFVGVLFSNTGENIQPSPDGVEPLTGADVCFTYVGPIARGDACTKWEGSYKSVFMAVGIEGVADQAERHEIVDRILQWFGASTGVEDPAGAAPMVRLAQNVPNPFRPSTSIRYELKAPGAVSLRVYDVSGRTVRTLIDGHQDALAQAVEWDGTDDAGRAVASGVYFYRLDAPGVSETRRMVLSR
jgi:hypothetical protein